MKSLVAKIFTRPAPMPPSNDRLGTFPAKQDNDNLPERRTFALNRILSLSMVLSLGINFLLAALLYMFFPLRTVQPWPIQVSPDTAQIVHMAPFKVEGDRRAALTEITLKEYVNLRYQILADEDAQNKRWSGRFRAYHTEDTWREFTVDDQDAYRQLRRDGWIQSVKIHSVSEMPSGIWKVDFTLTTSPERQPAVPNGTPQHKQRWNSYARVKWGIDTDEKTKKADLLLNPLSFKIEKYSHSKFDPDN